MVLPFVIKTWYTKLSSYKQEKKLDKTYGNVKSGQHISANVMMAAVHELFIFS